MASVELDRSRAPDGAELVLYQRDDTFTIRVDGLELMTSLAHGSEAYLAEQGCAGLPAAPRILIGGLGMGFTLRAALDVLPPDAEVEVVELVEAVVRWNRGPLAALGPVDDPRVLIRVDDVGAVLRAATPGRYNAILLDVDNGPVALTRPANDGLYSAAGLEVAARALAPGGCLGVWSADPNPAFEARLAEADLRVRADLVPARGRSGPIHTVFLARR